MLRVELLRVNAGHDEDASKAKLGKPVERMLQMACAMLDVVNDLTMLDGTKVKIRIGKFEEHEDQLLWKFALMKHIGVLFEPVCLVITRRMI